MLSPSVFEERRSSAGRLVALRVIAVACFAVLAVSFWALQVIGYEKYRDLADSNHVRTIALRAPRGVFYDRNSRVLVENRSVYSIAIIRERSTSIPEAVKILASVAGIDRTRIEETMRAHAKDPPFQPISVIDHATDAQVAAIMARRLELPEVVVQEVPVRAYPSGGMGAHLMGYVNEISANELKQAEYAGLTPRTMIGKTGLEKVYNAKLIGHDGKKDVFVDSNNREVGEAGAPEDPVDGQKLQLTIDFDLQRALEDAYKSDNRTGAAIFMDPRNGEVLAMTSQPEYDPNSFASGIDPATWALLTSDPDKPLTNRVIQNFYPPGSTWKVVMAIAALSEGLITPETQYTCYGKAQWYGRWYECDKHEGHGTLNLRQAIQQSCNVYFFNVGNALGPDKMHEYAEKLGLTGKTGIDLPGERESIIPSSEWKLRTQGEKWYPGDTISVAIGQGFVSVTPIALATMMSTVANGGKIVTPHVVKAVDDGHGWQQVGPPQERGFFPIKPEVLKPVTDGLWMVVNADGGTASKARIAGHDVVGKTGTAQVISKEGKAAAAGKTDMNLGDNSWFVFYAPRDNPQIAGVVFVEHGGHGGTTSAPIARHVLDTFFAKQEGRSLPVWPAKAVVTAPAAAGAARMTAPASPAGRSAGPGNPGSTPMIDERRLSAHLDWPLVGAIFALTLIGIAMIYSVKFESQPSVFWTQVYALPVAFAAMLLCIAIDYRTLAQRSWIFYVLLVLALIAVLAFGSVGGRFGGTVGAKRWLKISRFSLQPSEFARIVIALVLAMIYGDSRRRGRSMAEWTVGAVLVAIPALLIWKQPDFGTAVTLAAVFFAVIFVAGLRIKTLVIGAAMALLLSPVVYSYGLKPYQRARIEAFLNPEKDAKGSGYQQMQARIAVGAGGLAGKGFGQGTQGGYGFLPVAHNDFVFSVLAEEHGFIGVLAALSLYLFVILRSLEAAKLARDRVGAFLVVAIMSGFMVQVVYNITMAAGMAPVKGITLPLMSYGGSSLVATYAAFGLILNVRMRRFAN